MYEGFWSTRGRDDNNRFLAWQGVSMLIGLVTGAIPGLNVVGGLASTWVYWAAAVRRGHDIGRSAAFTLMLFVMPSLVAFGVAVAAFFSLFDDATSVELAAYVLTIATLLLAPSAWYLCVRGDVGDNDYGLEPRSAERRKADPERRRDATLPIAVVAIFSVLIVGSVVMMFSTLR